MTALPAIYYMHVWWARRPLVASRAAVLGSILPASADRSKFLQALGIHGDPVKTRQLLDQANRTGENLGANPYGYPRAFQYSPSIEEQKWIAEETSHHSLSEMTFLDPTAGGGSIPLEAQRLGLSVLANDLNPVASLLLRATLDAPHKFGARLSESFDSLAKEFFDRCEAQLRDVYPAAEPNERIIGYVWSRTVGCHYCDGTVPLSPHWRLAPGGVGIKFAFNQSASPIDQRRCKPVIVCSAAEQAQGTITDGDAICLFPDCKRVISGDYIKLQAQSGKMGEQLIAIAAKTLREVKDKSGKVRKKWVRVYRAPSEEEASLAQSAHILNEKNEGWELDNILPDESIGSLSNYDRGHRLYGIYKWRDFFSSRQLLSLGILVEVYRAMLRDRTERGQLSSLDKAAFLFLSLSIDKVVNFNCRQTRWGDNLERIVAKFDRHNYAMVWSYAEMPLAVSGDGLLWALGQTRTCLDELITLTSSHNSADFPLFQQRSNDERTTKIMNVSGESLLEIDCHSVDTIVMDPPYYDNVMYSELSDFFYVWLKRTAAYVEPDLFTRVLTDKENEAIANPAKFQGQKGAKTLAGRDYQERMARIFEECRRVLKPGGIMTLMFTHKATGAWDALTKGLIEAGFSISASWPINTEAEGSLHIKNKSAANSTIFLVCRPRAVADLGSETQYWEDVEPLVAEAVRARISEFQAGGIRGVDLYLASFGPALEVFSRNWPLKRGRPRPQPEVVRRRKQAALFEEEFDPYSVSPEDALEAARREVKRWRLEQLTHMKPNTEVDPLTSWFVLAWDAFRAPVFPYDEALRLARAVGVDLDTQVVGVLAEKKGSDLLMWDSARRAAKAALGTADGSRAMIDAVHHAANFARTRTLQHAVEMLTKAQVDKEPAFLAALEAVLEVLPVSKQFSGIDLDGDLASAGNDFEALENLRRLAFASQVDEPKQLDLWRLDEAA